MGSGPPNDEIPRLEAFGARLRQACTQAGATQTRLAWLAELTPGHLSRLERGQRRPRASTIARLADALTLAATEHQAPRVDAEVLALELVDPAGPALAPESVYSERITRRRHRRQRRRRRRWEQLARRVKWHAQHRQQAHPATAGLEAAS